MITIAHLKKPRTKRQSVRACTVQVAVRVAVRQAAAVAAADAAADAADAAVNIYHYNKVSISLN